MAAFRKISILARNSPGRSAWMTRRLVAAIVAEGGWLAVVGCWALAQPVKRPRQKQAEMTGRGFEFMQIFKGNFHRAQGKFWAGKFWAGRLTKP